MKELVEKKPLLIKPNDEEVAEIFGVDALVGGLGDLGAALGFESVKEAHGVAFALAGELGRP